MEFSKNLNVNKSNLNHFILKYIFTKELSKILWDIKMEENGPPKVDSHIYCL